MFPLWRQIVCFLTVIVTAHCMTVRRQAEGNTVPSASATPLRRKHPETDYDSAEVSAEDWEDVFQKNSPWNDTTLLPTSVYNFQTGEVSFFNWDLNGSAANNFPKSERHPKSVPITEGGLSSQEERPRRYSSKYAKEDESSPEENYEILKEPKLETESTEVRVPTEKDSLQREENEQYEVYEQQKKQPPVLDNEKAESGHESKKPTSKKHSEGTGEEHHEDHHNKKKTKGLKDYKGEHHYHKGEKGHHDKEGHKGQYSDKKGSTKKHNEGGGHFEAGVHGEKGQKEAKHSDKEEYKKGHSTRGGHVVHKKDEYEKKHEFYDEHHEGGDSEKHGEYHEEHHAKSGGHKKGGHKQGEAAGEHKAKKGHYEKGHKFHEQKGHKKAGGHEKKHGHDEKYGKKEAHSGWKKFEHESGKGGKGGDSGGAHSSVGHLLAVPPPPAQSQLPPIVDQGVAEALPQQSTTKIEEIEESHPSSTLPLHDTRAVFGESAPIPSTELKPPPFLAPKLLFIITPSEGIDFPLFQRKNSVVQMPMTFRGLPATKNILQDLDSFSDDSDSQRKMHKIVKKQMAVPDTKERVKSKGSAPNMLQNIDNGADRITTGNKRGIGNGADREMADGADGAMDNIPNTEAGNVPDCRAHSGIGNSYNDNGPANDGEYNSELCRENDKNIKLQGEVMDTIMKKMKEFAVTAEKFIPEKELLFRKKEYTGTEQKCSSCGNEEQEKLCEKKTFRLPDQNDFHCYYECEALPYGCMKLKHKQCPRGQFFSLKQMRCQKMYYWRTIRRKKNVSSPNSKKLDVPDPNPEDSEPSNEWVDATQNGATQKIPSEFKPKRKPMLKIYHLRVKRKLKELLLRMKAKRKRHVLSNLGSASTMNQRGPVHMSKGITKRHESSRRHHPRSFLIRINKKEGKHNQESITENDENDSDDGDNEEGDEEEDDDEDAEEDQEEPEEDENAEESEEKTPQKMSRKDSIKEFFKSAKAAVTNRAKFTEPSIPSTVTANKDSSSLKSNKSDGPSEKSKQVLLDANIKVDSAFSSALKNMLRNNQKDHYPMMGNEGLISDRGSQDQMDPELLRVYQHLIRNNPRVKRYFLANCIKKKN